MSRNLYRSSVRPNCDTLNEHHEYGEMIMNLIECDEKTSKDIMSYPEKYARGKYIYSYFDHKLNHDVWIATDNVGGRAWTEAFRKRNIAEAWLRGEFEVLDALDDDEDMIPIYEKYGCTKEDILE